MNTFHPENKEIRFIDSHYKDLFHIPDGGHIQIDYGNETVVKPCTFIDEYHTQVGNNVFHICQFAELMERNGNHYQAEPPIVGEEAAWLVGKDNYLAIQTCEDGYDYTLFDKGFKEIDGGQLDNPEMSIIEVRNEILADFHLEGKDLRAAIYDDVMEKADAIGFAELPSFMKPENYLKNAEMTMEDDYGMIDGVINNGKSAQVEDTNKRSVLEQLKKPIEREVSKKPPSRSMERD